ncbi:MAG TPA: hypothetical protein VK104_07745, partial [Burkholderiaceae bacterium]|nr:hypothetical protein [Burkholderiaceae bacterium]
MRLSTKLLLSSFVASLAMATSPAVMAKTVHVSYNVAEGSSWDQGAQVFKEEVEKHSDGAYKVSLHPNAA